MSERIIFTDLVKEYQIPWNWTSNGYEAIISFPSRPSYVRFRVKVYECGVYTIFGREVKKHLRDWIAFDVNNREAFSIFPIPPLEYDFPYEYISSDVSSYFLAGGNSVVMRFVKGDYFPYTHFFKVEAYIQSDIPADVYLGRTPETVMDIWGVMGQFMIGMMMGFMMMLMIRMLGEIMAIIPIKRKKK